MKNSNGVEGKYKRPSKFLPLVKRRPIRAYCDSEQCVQARRLTIGKKTTRGRISPMVEKIGVSGDAIYCSDCGYALFWGVSTT